MPRRVVQAEGHDRARALWVALAWLEALTVHGPGDVQGDPVTHGLEYSGFIADCYTLDGRGRRVYDSAFLSRPKGTDKSGLAARFGLLEALGPCRFAGWARGGEVFTDPWGLGFEYRYQAGEAMGRAVRVPYIRCLATEEGQTGHVYDAIYYNLTKGPLRQVPGVDPGLTRTFLPDGGEITPSTAGSASKDGGKETFAVFDETHLYVLPALREMKATVARNLRKRKGTAGTWYLETTTMFADGEDSAAEATFKLAEMVEAGQQDGQPRVRRERLLADHRWGECEDLTDEDALRAALLDAYGDAAEWVDVEGLIDEFYDPRADPVSSRRYFLNVRGGAADAWLEEHEWSARRADRVYGAPVEVGTREPVVLAFDGSRRRSRGVTDSTALVGVRVRDGHVFEIRVWEQPPGPQKPGQEWEVPRSDVDAAVDGAFARYLVVGFFADPAYWEADVARWESKYGARLKVKSQQKHPIQWWMTGGRSVAVVAATKAYYEAIRAGEMTHDGSAVLTTHHLNARRRVSRSGVQIGKRHPDSADKIDGATASIIGWAARLAALAEGLDVVAEQGVARRLDRAGRRRRGGGPGADRPL